LMLLACKFSFPIFSPKIACQAPKPPNSLKQKEIELHVSSIQTAILKIEIKKSPGIGWGFHI